MSEAGCPGVADPGAVIVKLAHEKVFRSYHWTFLYFISYDGLRNEWPKLYSWLFTIEKTKKASFKA
jgi:16S rRNA (cytidine1402-2'-O)-methyltransferase